MYSLSDARIFGDSRMLGNLSYLNPYFDYSSIFQPTQWPNALRWCEYVVMQTGILRGAIDRAISFFITDLVVENVDSDESEKYKRYLYDQLNIIPHLRLLAFDYITYGNAFRSLLKPYIYRLRCKSCSAEYPIDRYQPNDKLRPTKSGFSGKCLICNHETEFDYSEVDISDIRPLIIKRWNVYEIQLVNYDHFTDKYDIMWRINPEYRNAVLRGDINAVANAPRPVIDAILENQDFLFHRDFVYHGKDDTLCGIMLRGWGLSRIFTSIRHAWLVQVLHRQNEAIALDYTMPLRVITPMPRSAGDGGDPLSTISFGNFQRTIGAMIDQRRRDPTIWFASPYPIQYNSLGGDGRALAPREAFEMAVDMLLNSLNIPIEFYKGSTTLQALPLSLRMLETGWSHLVQVLNNFLSWLKDKLVIDLKWKDEVIIRLARPSHVDDINRQMAKLQMAMSGQISKTEGLRAFDIDFEKDLRRQMEEQYITAKETESAKKRMESLGMGEQMASGQMSGGPGMMGPGGEAMGMMGPGGGGAPPMQGGGIPAGGGGAGPMSMDPVQAIMASLPQGDMQNVNPMELDQLAQQLAMQIRGLPEPHKDSALRQLKSKNKLMWMVVKSKLDEMRAADQRAGVVQGLQQAAQMASSMPQPPG